MVDDLWEYTKGKSKYITVPEITGIMDDVYANLDKIEMSPRLRTKFNQLYMRNLSQGKINLSDAYSLHAVLSRAESSHGFCPVCTG